MYKHLHRRQADAALSHRLRDIVARVNNHSLAMLEEMFDFTLHENIYDAALVNDQAAAWASRVNLFDLHTQAELADWRVQVAQSV
jgi:hypothetical protein